MTIDRLDSSKILISLCRDDVSELSLAFGIDESSDQYTKRLLMRIVRFACSKTGMQVRNRPLLVETLEHKSGYLLLVTLTPESKGRATYRIKKKKDCTYYVFADSDAFLSAYEYLNGQKRILKYCKIIHLPDSHYIIAPYGFSFPEKSDQFLCEYGIKKKKSPISLAILCEKNSFNA